MTALTATVARTEEPVYAIGPEDIIAYHPGNIVHLIVKGPTQPQSRPHVHTRGRNIIVYNPNRQQQAAMRAVIRQALGIERGTNAFAPNTGLHASIIFHMRRPSRHFSGGVRRLDRIKENCQGQMPHTGIPDLDNMVKFVSDAMQGILYSDDSAIYSLTTKKIYDNNDQCDGRTEIKFVARVIDLTME